MVDGAVAAAARLRHKGLLLELIGSSSCGPSGTSPRRGPTTKLSTPHHRGAQLKGARDLQRNPDLCCARAMSQRKCPEKLHDMMGTLSSWNGRKLQVPSSTN